MDEWLSELAIHSEAGSYQHHQCCCTKLCIDSGCCCSTHGYINPIPLATTSTSLGYIIVIIGSDFPFRAMRWLWVAVNGMLFKVNINKPNNKCCHSDCSTAAFRAKLYWHKKELWAIKRFAEKCFRT